MRPKPNWKPNIRLNLCSVQYIAITRIGQFGSQFGKNHNQQDTEIPIIIIKCELWLQLPGVARTALCSQNADSGCWRMAEHRADTQRSCSTHPAQSRVGSGRDSTGCSTTVAKFSHNAYLHAYMRCSNHFLLDYLVLKMVGSQNCNWDWHLINCPALAVSLNTELELKSYCMTKRWSSESQSSCEECSH